MMIQLLHAAFVYQSPDGEVEALRDVSFDVQEGEFCSIVGPSGCGKSTLLSALAGIIEVARLSSAQPTAGTGYELDAIAAVVLGGTSLAGGKGRIVGTLIGALILGFLNNGLNLLGVSSYYQMIVKAVVILLAVLVDNKKQ